MFLGGGGISQAMQKIVTKKSTWMIHTSFEGEKRKEEGREEDRALHI